MQYLDYVERANQFFDDLIEHASDDELFASGYLRGHFDLQVGYAQVDNLEISSEDLNELVEKSLVTAYRNGELTEQDRDHVVAIWEKLKQLV